MVLVLLLLIIVCLKESYQLDFKRSTTRTIETSNGRRTITSLETNIKADINTVYGKLCSFNTWNDWISPGSKFTSTQELDQFSNVGDTVDETFGIFQSSKITWELREIKPKYSLKVCSRASQATVGWNQLELEFCLSPSGSSTTNLLWLYSWTVKNPLVCFIEEKFVRQSMINDNLKALNKFSLLCSEK